MELSDYLRDQAVMYRQLAERSDDPVVKNEMLELASVCETAGVLYCKLHYQLTASNRSSRPAKVA